MASGTMSFSLPWATWNKIDELTRWASNPDRGRSEAARALILAAGLLPETDYASLDLREEIPLHTNSFGRSLSLNDETAQILQNLEQLNRRSPKQVLLLAAHHPDVFGMARVVLTEHRGRELKLMEVEVSRLTKALVAKKLAAES
jgi:hypothetical protein